MTTNPTAGILGGINIARSTSLAELAARIKAEHEAVRLSARQTVDHAIRAGELLLQAKELVSHGMWGDWLHEHCDASERTAQVYMRLARHRLAFESNPQLSADLTIDDAVRALAKPKPSLDTDLSCSVVQGAADHLPGDGQARIGIHDTTFGTEIFIIIESEKYPSFFDIDHLELLGGEEDDVATGLRTQTKKPVRADGIRSVLEFMLRRPDTIDAVEWHDAPADHWRNSRLAGWWSAA